MTEFTGGNLDFRPAYKRSVAILRHDIAGLYLFNAEHTSITDFRLKWAAGMPAYFTDGLRIEKSDTLT